MSDALHRTLIWIVGLGWAWLALGVVKYFDLFR